MNDLPPLQFSTLGRKSPDDALLSIFMQAGVRQAEMGGPEHFDSLAVGAPDNGLLHADLAKRLYDEALTKHGPSVLNYRFTGFEQPLQGFFESRNLTFPDSVGLMATSGGMEAINLAARSLLDEGDIALVETPAFTGTLGIFQEIGVRTVGVECGPDGIKPEALEKAIKTHKPKLISLMPDNNNPTGSVMPVASRKAIADLLKKHNVLAIEDGAYYELSFDGTQLPPLQSYAPNHVLYAMSFSKILWPAIRTGFLVGRKDVLKVDARMKFNFNMVTSPVTVAMVERFLTLEGGRLLEKRITELRTTYAKRWQAMEAAFTKYLRPLGVTWAVPKGGMFAMIEAAGVDFDQVFTHGLEQGVAIVPGSKCGATANTARINCVSSPEARIPRAVSRLAAAMQS